MKNKNSRINYFVNLIFPALVFGAMSGTLTSIFVVLYKFCAMHIISVSERCYEIICEYPMILIIVAVLMLGVSLLYTYIYKKHPNLKGGGIPTSISMLRGTIRFKWIENSFGVFIMSLITFLFGVPLGNEGPSVQIGTAIGKGCVSIFAKKRSAWTRYAMTGGACAGFAVATGAPVSGILFALEEAHQRISPMILTVSAVSVIFAKFTSEILSPVLGVSPHLFPSFLLPEISL